MSWMRIVHWQPGRSVSFIANTENSAGSTTAHASRMRQSGWWVHLSSPAEMSLLKRRKKGDDLERRSSPGIFASSWLSNDALGGE
jgi:hypothetical protein